MAAAIVEKFLPDVTGEDRHGQVTLDTWFDRLMKALTVWLPLLVSGTLFLGEITGEPQNVFCFPPSNFTIPQANYLNAFCKESLVSVPITPSMFPYFVLSFGLLMYIPHFLWKTLIGTKLASQITMITNQIECGYTRLMTNTAGGVWCNHDNTGLKRALIEDFSVLFNVRFLENLRNSKKLWKFQTAKNILWVIFALACLTYLMTFNLVSQQDTIFLCRAKINFNNDTESDKHLESACRVIGVKHLYFVSMLLTSSFFIAVPLFIVFVIYMEFTKNNFLLSIRKILIYLAKEMAEVEFDQLEVVDTSTDLSIIGRLCGENRHLIPSLDQIIRHAEHYRSKSTADVQGGDERTEGDPSANADGTQRRRHPRPDPNSDDRDNDDTMNSDDSGAGPDTGSMHDIEAEIHHQNSSEGSSSSEQSFHTEDETREKDLAGEEKMSLMPVHRRHCKNKSDSVEKETNV